MKMTIDAYIFEIIASLIVAITIVAAVVVP